MTANTRNRTITGRSLFCTGESLEPRTLLSVSIGEYEAIRSDYPEFGLPVDTAQVNIIEIGPDELGVAQLKAAVAAAAGTSLPDLVVLRTNDTQNRIAYATAGDTLAIDVPAGQGSISIVSLGSTPLTLDASSRCGVISIGNSGSTTLVNLGGIVLTGGSATSGGGIRQSFGTLNLKNAAIVGNAATYGGGIYQDSGSAFLSAVQIIGNNAMFGAGVYGNSSALTLGNSTLRGNSASESGGGVFLYFGRATLTGVTIEGNRAARGGGIAQTYGTLALTNAMITGNRADYGGGGIHQTAGTLNMSDARISGNASREGGGYYQGSGTSALTNILIADNTAERGGGIWQEGVTSTAVNTIIAGNSASEDGGGIWQAASTTTLTNVTISANGASNSGGGIYQHYGPTTLTLGNVILADNRAVTGPDLRQQLGTTVTGANSLIGDGTGQTSLRNGERGNLVGTAAVPIDPLLAEGTANGTGLAPLAGSPAVDAGDDSLLSAGMAVDLYGQPRVQGASVNIGAVETLVAPQPGVTYVVNSLADVIANDGVLTLREALAAANGNTAIGDAAAGSYTAVDRIEFAPGLSGTIRTNGEPYTIRGSLRITGPGADVLTLDAQRTSGVLRIVAARSVEIERLKVTGGAADQGAGIYSDAAVFHLKDMVITGSSARDHGGGVRIVAGNTVMDHVTFTGNEAMQGGAVRQDGGQLTITNVHISGNTAGNSGGGVLFSRGVLSFTNGVISNNAAASGAGLFVGISTATITNATITFNVARGAFSSGGGVYLNSSTLTLHNSIVGLNTAEIGVDLTQTPSGTGNLIGTDPLFVRNPAPGADRNWGTADDDSGDLHLRPESPAVNGGDSALVPAGIISDLAGNARIALGAVDIGAYEMDQAPVGIVLSGGTVPENQPAGTLVGTLLGVDPDNGDTFTYAVVTGTGDADNNLFQLTGGELRTAAMFNYELRREYSIRARVTDSGGLTYETVLTIAVADLPDTSTPFGMVSGKSRTLTISDAGDDVTFSLRGGGTGMIDSGGLLLLTGTTASTVLTISVRRRAGGDGVYWLGGILSAGSLKTIMAPGVFVGGDIEVHTDATPATSAVAMTLGGIRDGRIDTHGLPIRSLRMTQWKDTDATRDQLVAPWIGTITVTGKRENPRTSASEFMAGDWEADVLTSSANRGVGVTSMKVGGALSGSRIIAAGRIGSITAGKLESTDILVGVNPQFGGMFATSAGEFENPAAQLGRLTLTGLKLPRGAVHPAYVVDSHVSAPRIIRASLANVPIDTGAILHIATDTGTLAVRTLADGMLAAGRWPGPVAGRPDIVERIG